MSQDKLRKKSEVKKVVKEILKDIEFLQPGMIIEEKEPFFWRMHPDWVKRKTQEIWVAIRNLEKG